MKIKFNLPENFSFPNDYPESKLEIDLNAIFSKRLELSNDYHVFLAFNKTGNTPDFNQNSNPKEQTTTFIATEPKFTMEQVILPDELKVEIDNTLTILEKQHIIYDEWGFSEIDPSPKSILNFHGAPGTGKTMMAQAIADRLGTKIMAVNYSEIESKYVGDAPKNLQKAFETAQTENALLFFDEADSFLGKRIQNVSGSSDQAINSLRSQMLIFLGNFSGVVIFATNLVDNYDKTFESRIFKHIKFELPNEILRSELIKKMIPNKVPFEDNQLLNDEQLQELIELSDGFSGRELKNSILLALSSAVSANKDYVNFTHFKTAFESTKKSKQELNSNKKIKDVISEKMQKGDYKTFNVQENKDELNTSQEEVKSEE